MSYKGLFKPRHPAKYKGDITNIIYRSSWELRLMVYLDSHPNVITWGSEELIIPYRSPIDNKIHRYFPDFVVTKRGKAGNVETVVIEVKPYKETHPPAPQTKRTPKYLREVYTWGINEAKWTAARNFCENRGWEFIIMTEKELNLPTGKSCHQ